MKNKLLHSFRLRATMLVAMMLCVVNAAWGADETITFQEKYSSNTTLDGVAISGTDFSVTFNKRSGGTATQYYTNGYAVRWYGGGTLVVSSSTKTITQIDITFTQTANSISTNVGTYSLSNSVGTWTGSANSVTFTQSGTSGQCRVSSIAVTYEASGSSLTDNDLTLNASEKTFDLADGANQTFQLTNSGSADGALSYASNDETVATVTNAGLITAVGEGTATITVTQAASSTYKGGSATCTVTVSDSRYMVSNLTFTEACGGSGTANDGAAWTVESDGTESVYDGTSGIHYGTNSANVTYLQLSTSDINGQVSRVVVNARDAQAKATISVTVGGVAFTCTGSATATNTSTDYTFTGTGTGVIVVRIDRGSSMSKAIYVKSVKVSYVESNDPSISADYVNIAYDATEGSFDYTINNPVQDGVVSVDFDSEGDWLLTATDNNGTVSFTCTANATNAEREAVVQIIYTYNNDVSVTKEVLITQAAAPVTYTTIPALFTAATSTETDVRVTFGGWVVSAVHNNNAYLTDNQGHGLIIYASDHGFQVNDMLTGTVSCKLVLYRGSAELTNLTTSTEGLTVTSGGTVTAQTIAISDLGGVNTGALLSFEGLTYNGTALVDGNSNTITPYTTLYSGTFESGKSYDVTGIYAQYNDTKEILPRSAADIVEVVSSEPSITVATTTVNVAATDDNGTIGITYDNLSISDESDFDIQFCDAVGNALSAGSEPTWIVVEVAEDNNDYVVSYIMNENTSSEARSAYFKVFAMGDAELVYSDLITVTQAGVVIDYATLPFIWAGGSKNDLTATNGVTAYSLGNDYADSYAPYLVKLDGTNDYIQVKTNAQPGIAFISVKMIGGGDTSTITVQESADGSDFEDVEALTISGKQNDILELGTTTAFAATTRYVRFLFTKGSNVGVGPITITKPLKLNASGYATIASTSGLDFSSANYTAWVVTSVDGETINFTNVTEAPANTGLLLKGTEDNAVTLSKTDNAADIATNLLEAITTATAVTTGQYYGLSGDEFVSVNAGTVPAGKALLPASVLDNNVKAFTFVFVNTATGVRTVETVSAEDAKAIFNLAGQRVNKAVKGIFIQNGKKIVVR